MGSPFSEERSRLLDYVALQLAAHLELHPSDLACFPIINDDALERIFE